MLMNLVDHYRLSGFNCEYLLNANCKVSRIAIIWFTGIRLCNELICGTLITWQRHVYACMIWRAYSSGMQYASVPSIVDKIYHEYPSIFLKIDKNETSSQTQLAPNILWEVNQAETTALQWEEEGNQHSQRVRRHSRSESSLASQPL